MTRICSKTKQNIIRSYINSKAINIIAYKKKKNVVLIHSINWTEQVRNSTKR